MNIMDILDDFVFGPMNLISRTERLVKEQIYDDRSVQFALLRLDKGGSHGFYDVQNLLNKYGIVVYGVTHDSQYLYFNVKQRQAAWAEYLLLHARVNLRSTQFVEPRNAKYVAAHPEGWMPRPWIDGKKETDVESDEISQSENLNETNNGSISDAFQKLISWII